LEKKGADGQQHDDNDDEGPADQQQRRQRPVEGRAQASKRCE
jgi:hypothetical protein